MGLIKTIVVIFVCIHFVKWNSISREVFEELLHFFCAFCRFCFRVENRLIGKWIPPAVHEVVRVVEAAEMM